LPKKEDKNLIVGYESSDDAAVYKISEDKAIIQTLDFFTTMINDPYLYGQIAATNALSDIYAMGGEVISALNIVAFPEKMDMEILHQILKGGAEKVHEAGGVLAGGHSIHDSTPKYGLSVTGIIHPDKILMNNNCKEGDVLIGGLYGLKMGKIFCGESMFSKRNNASEYGFITYLQAHPDIALVDCQIYSEYLKRLGAEEIPRKEFLTLLGKAYEERENRKIIT